MNLTNDPTLQEARDRTQQLPRESWIHVTSAAADHIQRTLSEDPNAIGLRVGVTKSGCSGFGYIMDFARSTGPDDFLFEATSTSGKKIPVLCDQTSLPMLKGSTLDYVVNGLSRLLKFDNPNVVDSCGCGESFTIKDENSAHA